MNGHLSFIYPDFTPEGFGMQIFRERYAVWQKWDNDKVVDAEAWDDAVERVATHIANAERGEHRSIIKQNFHKLLRKGLFMPGGRIWYGSGREKGNLLNCYVIPIEDSKEGWGKALYDSTVISCTGGGVGMNGSAVRPSGANISGHGGQATGPLSIFKMINGIGTEIKAGGTRRVALMQCLNHDHPDIMTFLNAKLDLNELNNANISTVFMNEDPVEFFKKVDNDEDMVLKHNGKVYGKVKASLLWNKIIENSIRNGEPGILNGWYANKDSNISYHTSLISTNPCGEIWLSEYENCCLGAVVLPRFVDAQGNFDWDGFRETIHATVRFLDNVLTVNYYPMAENKTASEKYRRIGLGVMGLHDMLLKMGYKYSNGYHFVDRVMRFMRNEAYLASAFLAAEKGSFPAFDADKVLAEGTFASKLPARVKNAIRQYGLRNCAILTIAPTGTTSIVQGVTSGIEPMFAYAWKRRYFVKDEKKEEVVHHPLFVESYKNGQDLSIFEGAQDLTPEQHLEMQAVCQKYVDNAVSKTINIKQGMELKDFDAVLRKYVPLLKGLTIYPVGSRGEEPLSPLSLKDAIEMLGEAVVDHKAAALADAEQACANGVCEVPWAKK